MNLKIRWLLLYEKLRKCALSIFTGISKIKEKYSGDLFQKDGGPRDGAGEREGGNGMEKVIEREEWWKRGSVNANGPRVEKSW